MRLVDKSIITKAEGVFYNSMSSVLDQENIVKLFKENYDIRLSGSTQFQDMDLVVFNDNVAFRFDYTATAYFSILMDRNGEFLEMEENTKQSEVIYANSNNADSLIDTKFIREKESQLADTIADAIDRETLVRLIEINSHANLNGQLDFMGAQFTVYRNRRVYNLIYQGEIALSFLLDQKGRFLDFADPQSNSYDKKHSLRSSDTNPSQLKEIFIEENDLEDSEIPELIENSQIETIYADEADSISKLFIDKA